jgi:RNA polymerase sigma factor FliA
MDTRSSIIVKSINQKQKKMSDSDIDVLWNKYTEDKTNKEIRDRIIVQYIYLIKYVVGRLRISLPSSIATDDIAGYGVEGLIDAIDRFIPSRGVRFETYALMRVRGAIIDRIRSQDWVPRGTQRRFKKIQNTILKLQLKLGRTPTTAEIAVEIESTKEKVESTMAEMESNTLVSLYDSRDSSSDSLEIIDTIQDVNSPDPLNQLESKDIKKELSNALSKLPERERMILALYYHENMTLKEIGEAITISESRVCQLHAQAIMKLRKLLMTRELNVGKIIK